MKPSLYLETSVVSYLVARPSRDVVTAAHQRLTAEWWDVQKPQFDLYVSELVLGEARKGDPEVSRRRLVVLEGLPILATTPDALNLAATLVADGLVPEVASADAFHIAIAAVHQMDYLATWNCRHIANAQTRRRIGNMCRRQGFGSPVLCTPEELMGG